MGNEPEQSWKAEASHPETSAQQLTKLSTDPHLCRIVAANPSAPGNLLEQLARAQDRLVRQAVASNPNTPWHMLEQLAWEFPREFLHNPVGQLQILAHSEHISTKDLFWGSLLRETLIPSHWWMWVKSHPTLGTSQMVRLHVQYAGEVEHPYDVPQNEEEHVLLTLVELLAAASEQEETYGYARENHPLADQPASLCQNSIEAYLQRLAHGLDPEVRQAVAAHPYIPVKVLLGLAQDEDPAVRKIVAEQMQTPGEILHRLAQDKDPMVCLPVARQEQTSGEALYALARDEDEEVRRTVAGRSHLPVKILLTLAQDEDGNVRQAVAEHAQTPGEILRILARDEDENVRQAVARNQHLPVDVLLTLARDHDVGARWEIASHPQTPGEILRILAMDESASVRSNVASHRQTPGDILRLLSQDESESVRSMIAGNPHTSEEILRTLAEDQERAVRQAVAGNPHTPGEVLHRLCLDPYERVRRAVAENLHAPEEVLRTLANNVPQNTDVHHNLGLAVAMHPHVSAETLHLLMHYPHVLVRWQARFVQKLLAAYGDEARKQAWWAELHRLFVNAHNSAWISIFSIETQLEEIAALDIPEHLRQMVITALAARWDNKHTFAVTDERDAATILRTRLSFYKHLLSPFLPPAVLQKLVASPHWEVRYLMALHENTPRETRQQLCQDGNRYVRAIAQAHTKRTSQTVRDK